MGFLSTAEGYRVDNYLGSKNKVAISEVTAGANPYTSQNMFGPGIEINPANGESLVIERMKGSSRYMVTIGGTNQGIAPDTDRGERRIYSVSADGSEIKAIAKFKNDGILELNGATSFAVKFEQLETALNTFVAAVNVAFAAKLDGGGTSPALSLNITPAKSSDVKLS